MARDKPQIIKRELLTQRLVRARSNHIDKGIVTLVTFLPFENHYGKTKDKIDFTTIEDVPVLIVRDSKGVWFDFISEADQVFIIDNKKYQIMGYPQPSDTMLSQEMFVQIFGKQPVEHLPRPTNKLPKVDPVAVLQEIVNLLKKYVGFFDAKGKKKDDLYLLVAYWIMQTYIYDVWSKTSYLKIMGVHDSGKSTLSRIIEMVSFCGEKSVGKVSESWFYRNLHNVGGVQCLDELELDQKDHAQFLDLLKSGWEKDAYIRLSNKHDPNKPEKFNVYSPKVVAGTSVQNIDAVLSSRMIEITMRTAPSGFNFSIEDLYDEEFKDTARELRDKLYLFRLRYGHEFLKQKKALLKGTAKLGNLDKEGKEILSNRQMDIYAPILTLARDRGGRHAVRLLEQAIKEQIEIKRTEFFETYNLPILKVIFEATRTVKQQWMTAQDISDTIVSDYAGDDNIKRRHYLAKYDFPMVERALKGLGLSRDTRYSMDGVEHLFHRDDLDRYVKNRGLKKVVEAERHLDSKIVSLLKTMNELRDNNKNYADYGIPLDVIEDTVGFNPSFFLHRLANQRSPPVMEVKPNVWKLILYGGW